MALEVAAPCIFGQTGALRLLKEYPGGKATTTELYDYMTKNYPPSSCMRKDMLSKALRRLLQDGVISASFDGRNKTRNGRYCVSPKGSGYIS